MRPTAAEAGPKPGAAHRVAAGWLAVLVVAASIGLVVLAARSGRTAAVTAVTSPSPGAAPTTVMLTPGPDESGAPPGRQSRPPLPVNVFLGLLLAGMLAGFGYLVWAWMTMPHGRFVRRRRRTIRRQRPAPASAGPPPAALAEAVDAGLRRLEEGEPQDAVIACWVMLERAAAEAGTARRPAETPAELVARVLAEHRVTAAVLDRLARLYREARYSGHVLGEAARGEARTALRQIRGELTGEAPVRQP